MKVKTHTQGIGVSNTKHSTCERLEKGRERKRKARAKGKKRRGETGSVGRRKSQRRMNWRRTEMPSKAIRDSQ